MMLQIRNDGLKIWVLTMAEYDALPEGTKLYSTRSGVIRKGPMPFVLPSKYDHIGYGIRDEHIHLLKKEVQQLFMMWRLMS